MRTGYSDITSASVEPDGLRIQFANGDEVTYPQSLVGIANGDLTVTVERDDPTKVRVSSTEGARDIDWMQIRSATDRTFAEELRDRDAQESRRLGRRLKALREDRGISQRDLADLVGMTAPQLSKIENGETDMRVSTIRSLLRAMGADFSDVAGPDAPEMSLKELTRLAVGAGAPKELVGKLTQFLPRRETAHGIAAAFNWAPESLLAGTPTTGELPVGLSFKAGAAQDPHGSPLLQLAFRVSQVSIAGTSISRFTGIPDDPSKLRRAILRRHHAVSLSALLEWAWESGVPVVPLLGKKAFFAVAWEVEGTPVIVLKDSRPLLVMWLFDLAHEIGHIARGHIRQKGLVDLSGPGPSKAEADKQEREANAYALDLLMPDHEELLAAVRELSGGHYLALKGAIAAVADKAGVSPGLLGMFAAYQLDDIGEPKDRWGSATNLAKPEGQGRVVVENEFWRRIKLAELSDADTGLLRAVTKSGEE